MSADPAAAPVITLRPMRWWDIDAVLPLERALFPRDPWTAAGFWSELAGVPDTRYYLVAEADGEVVGYAGLFATADSADVQTIAVRPDRPGTGPRDDPARGAARTRPSAAVPPRCMLEVRADNARGAARCTSGTASSGWPCAAATTGPGADAVVMRRRLAG